MTNELNYSKQVSPLTRDELISRLHDALSDGRFQHVLRVEQTAMELAKENDADVELASVAGLVHDYAKQRPDADFIQIIRDEKMDPDLLNYGNAIWHGVVGASLIRNELGIENELILNAVREHTTGAPYMSKLSQILFMADFIEPGRDFPGVEKARNITHQNLQQGVAFQATHTVEYLIQTKKIIYPKSILTYNAWVHELSDHS